MSLALGTKNPASKYYLTLLLLLCINSHCVCYSGSYCCIAHNCMGEASSTAELTIEDIQSQLSENERSMLITKNQPPRFLQNLKSTEGKINEKLTFTVKGNY